MNRDGKRELSLSVFTSEGFAHIFPHELGHYAVENPGTPSRHDSGNFRLRSTPNLRWNRMVNMGLKSVQASLRAYVRFMLICMTVFGGHLSWGAGAVELLFSGHKASIPLADQKQIVALLPFAVSVDGKHLESKFGCGIVEHETSLLNLKKDGAPEVLVIAGNTCTSGHIGSTAYLFVQDRKSRYRLNLGVPALDVQAVPTTSPIADLKVITGSGCSPVWRWGMNQYEHYCNVADSPTACAGQELRKLCKGGNGQ